MSTGQWVDINDGVPKNGQTVLADWINNKTGESYICYATWDKDNRGWTISNADDFTVTRWRKDD